MTPVPVTPQAPVVGTGAQTQPVQPTQPTPSTAPDMTKPHSTGDVWNASTGNWELP